MRRDMLPGIVIALIVAGAFGYSFIRDVGPALDPGATESHAADSAADTAKEALHSAEQGGEIVVPVLDGHIYRAQPPRNGAAPPETEPPVEDRPAPAMAREPIPEPRPPVPEPRPVEAMRPFIPRF